jgi:hypothetical protein
MGRIRPSIRVLAAVIALVGFGMAAPMTAAHDSCTHGKVTFYEDAGLNGDHITFCFDDSDLFNNPHTQPGTCNALVVINDSWNDCVSSFSIDVLASGHCLQLYNSQNFANVIGPEYWGPGAVGGYNITGAWNDALTSFRFGTTSATC